MSNLDRKNLLWESSRMFLPEHRQSLLNQRKETERFLPPELDEQQLEEFSYLLQEAFEQEQPILVTYVGDYEAEQFCGFIDKIDPLQHFMQLSNGSMVRKVPFQLLLGVEYPSE